MGDSVSIQWVPSHVSMEGNEQADGGGAERGMDDVPSLCMTGWCEASGRSWDMKK